MGVGQVVQRRLSCSRPTLGSQRTQRALQTEPFPTPPSPPQTHPLHQGQPEPSHTSPPGGRPSLARPPGAAQSSARLPCLPAGTGVGKKHRTGSEADSSLGTEAKPPSHSAVPIRYLTYPRQPLPFPPMLPGCSCRGKQRFLSLADARRAEATLPAPTGVRDPRGRHQTAPDTHVPSPCSCRGRAANLCVL